MALNGNILIVLVDGHAIAGTKTNEIQVESELIEIASATQGAYREYLTGRKQWQVTVNYLLMYASYQVVRTYPDAHLADVLFVGNSYTLKFTNRVGTLPVTLKGTAILRTCKITATRGNLIQGTFTFVGNGALSAE